VPQKLANGSDSAFPGPCLNIIYSCEREIATDEYGNIYEEFCNDRVEEDDCIICKKKISSGWYRRNSCLYYCTECVSYKE
jgi:hypothetical protein